MSRRRGVRGDAEGADHLYLNRSDVVESDGRYTPRYAAFLTTVQRGISDFLGRLNVGNSNIKLFLAQSLSRTHEMIELDYA